MVAGDFNAERLSIPVERQCPFGMPSEYAQLRAERPVATATLPDGDEVWVVTSHEYARQLLADARLSVNRGHPRFPHPLSREGATGLRTRGMLSWMDPPEHTECRRMLINEFTIKRLRSLRPAVREIVDEHLSLMTGSTPPVDLVQALAVPVTQLVICELLGIPESDRAGFNADINIVLDRAVAPRARLEAWNTLRSYLGDLISGKTAAPADDLISRLARKCGEAGKTDHDLLIGLVMNLRTGGHESTANMIALSVVALLSHPDQLADLRADGSLAPQAIEELLRFFSIGDWVTGRVTTDDIVIGDVRIPKGRGVIVLNAAANHDQDVFANPASLDIHREAGRHLAFGHGIHQCIGQNLARLELEILLTTLFARIPSLRLAVPAADLTFVQDGAFHGVREVPVTW
ncbi:MAG: cytochrome P450 [Trebonia sp.]